jgi:nicotinate phosphoribosyltransferase
MERGHAWVSDRNMALVTDLYQLTMLQSYWKEGMEGEATFSLYSRRLPEQRNFMLACGLDDVLHYLEALRFSPEGLEYLAGLGSFTPEFLDWLAEFRFRGDVRAVPEGTAVFPQEPLLEVTAPLPQAQLVETFIMNQVHFQTLAASKAARVVEAAAGRAVVDFGLRRIHGADAGLKGARAFYIGGVSATSHVLAGQVYGIPVAGTMAHSFIQAHSDEDTAFRAFADLYPGTTLLVDTYDTLEGVHKVVELHKELGDEFRVGAIRLDSGNLVSLARKAREVLDHGGLEMVKVFASGGLDELQVDQIVKAGAPVDGFGVGTLMSVSADAPSLDMAYKLTSYAGKGRLKLSPGKPIFPGRKQVFRAERDGTFLGDVVARQEEDLPGRPLLTTVMRDGRRLPEGTVTLESIREHAAREIASLPARVRSLAPADPPFPVEISRQLLDYQAAVAQRFNAD